MVQTENCPECGRALEGAIEVSSAQIGGLNIVVVSETPDRNWIECDGCSAVLCKSCCILPDSGYCDSCVFKLKIEPSLAARSCHQPAAAGVIANQNQNIKESK